MSFMILYRKPYPELLYEHPVYTLNIFRFLWREALSLSPGKDNFPVPLGLVILSKAIADLLEEFPIAKRYSRLNTC